MRLHIQSTRERARNSHAQCHPSQLRLVVIDNSWLAVKTETTVTVWIFIFLPPRILTREKVSGPRFNLMRFSSFWVNFCPSWASKALWIFPNKRFQGLNFHESREDDGKRQRRCKLEQIRFGSCRSRLTAAIASRSFRAYSQWKYSLRKSQR